MTAYSPRAESMRVREEISVHRAVISSDNGLQDTPRASVESSRKKVGPPGRACLAGIQRFESPLPAFPSCIYPRATPKNSAAPALKYDLVRTGRCKSRSAAVGYLHVGNFRCVDVSALVTFRGLGFGE